MKISTLEVMEAVNRMAIEAVPELAEVYIDLRPKNFRRPSLLIEAVTTDTVDAAAGLVMVTESITLTLYDVTDEYSRTGTDSLLTMQEKLLGVFRRGYLRVGDRAPKVQASTGGRDQDKAYIDMQISYFEVKNDVADSTPMMESIHTELNTKKG